MVKYIATTFCFILLSVANSFAAVPETILTVDGDNFLQWVGKTDVLLPDPITLEVDPTLITQSTTINLQWGDCISIHGGNDFSLKVQGINNIKQLADSLQLEKGNTRHTTKAWLTLIRTTSGDYASSKHRYLCPMLGTIYYPITITKEPVSYLIVEITIPPVSCELSAPAIVTMPALSKKNTTSTNILPLTVRCESVDEFSAPASVNLTATGGNSNTHLYDDDNVSLDIFYGDDSANAGTLWKADGVSTYPVGVLNGNEVTVQPVIRAVMKENASPGQYKTSIVVNMNIE